MRALKGWSCRRKAKPRDDICLEAGAADKPDVRETLRVFGKAHAFCLAAVSAKALGESSRLALDLTESAATVHRS